MPVYTSPSAAIASVFNPSDDDVTEVFSLAAFPSSFANTDWIEVKGFTNVEFQLSGSINTVTDLTALVQYTANTGSGGTYELSVENLDTSASPVQVNQYAYRIFATGSFSTSDGEFAVPVPVHGRYMRLRFFGGPSVGTDQVKVNAYRRSS